MSRASQRRIKSYSVWLEGNPDSYIPTRYLGAYIGLSFTDACKRACWDRFGMDKTTSCFHVSKSGTPYFSGFKLYTGRN